MIGHTHLGVQSGLPIRYSYGTGTGIQYYTVPGIPVARCSVRPSTYADTHSLSTSVDVDVVSVSYQVLGQAQISLSRGPYFFD